MAKLANSMVIQLPQAWLNSGPLKPVRLRLRNPLSRARWLASLAVMMEAGVPIQRALAVLSTDRDEPALAYISASLTQDVEKGQTLSQGLARFPSIFSDFQMQLVRVGERTGLLGLSLSRLAHYEEKSQALALKMKSALYYPVFIAVLGLALVLLAPPLLFKGMLPMLKSSGQTLPWFTRAFMGFSEVLRRPALWLILGGLLVAAQQATQRALKHRGSARRLRQTLLKSPALGDLLRTASLSRFARALALQLKIGCSPFDSLILAGDCSLDRELQGRMPAILASLKNGHSLAESLNSSRFFPRGFIAMLEVAEEVGDVPDMSEHLADFYDEHLEVCAASFGALLEPLVMMVLGILAGGVMIAMLLPMVKMMESFL